MELRPSSPPGNAQRKARAFHAEIVRLRAEGYTHAAIHQALVEAGVDVSLATVKREAARVKRTNRAALRAATPAPATATLPQAPSTVRPLHSPQAINGPQSGRDFAEAFAATVQTNPLLKRK